MNPRPVNVEYNSAYKLIITFVDGKVKLSDLKPYLHYPVYQTLKDEVFCSKALIKYGTIVWNEEIDFDPDRLYLESEELIRVVN